MRKSLKFVFVSLSTLMLSYPMVVQLTQIPTVSATEIAQQQMQKWVALGASLSEEQVQETLKLLGADQINQAKMVRVDGNMVNKYIHDGSNQSTNVYSSAYIESMPAGHGVQVQIVTPDNILNVSPLTYQNAAITAGAKDVNIRVATVNPVTGDGALAGVYELLSNSGVKMNQTNINVAQKEIKMISEIGTMTKLDQTIINQIISEVKIYIITNEGKFDDASLKQQMTEIFKKYRVDIAKYPEVVKLIIDFAESYKETETDSDTVDQLEKSITPIWSDVLSSINDTVTIDEFNQRERVTFADKDSIRPEIKALANKFYQDVDATMRGELAYSLSFAIETMTPDLTNEEKIALNELRTEIYYYSQAVNQEIGGTTLLKDLWLGSMSNFDQVKVSYPEIAEMYLQIGVKTGMMPQAYKYQVVGQQGSLVFIEVIEETSEKVLTHRYQIDLATGEIMNYAETGATPVTAFDYASVLGSNLTDNHPVVEIPVDYKVPIEMIKESIYDYPTEETTIEETSEETTEDITDLETESSVENVSSETESTELMIEETSAE